VPRLAYLLYARPEFDGVYWAMADALLRDGSLAINGTSTTDFEPLYPIFLSLSRMLTGNRVALVQVVQVAVASLGGLYLYRLAESLTGQRRVAAISAVLFAVDPLLVRQAALHSDAALTTTLLIGFASCFVSSKTIAGAARAGLWLGAVILCRTMTLPLVIAGAGVLMVDRRFRAAAAMTVAALLVFMPLVVRNHAVNGSWLPTRSGLNLYVGNSPYSAALLPDDDVDLLIPVAEAIVARERPDLTPEAPDYARVSDAVLTRHSRSHISEDPPRAIGQKVLNILYFFSIRPVPYRVIADDTRLVIRDGKAVVENAQPRPLAEVVVYSVSYTLVLASALAGLFLRRTGLRRDVLLWCVTGTFVAVHAIYFPATRYRAPMTFVLWFHAAVAFDRALQRISSGSRRACEKQAFKPADGGRP
jgi:hypothetical protein